MSRLEELNKVNKVRVNSVRSDAFRSYGRVIEGYDVSALIRFMEDQTAIPEQGNVYVASVPEMEAIMAADPASAALTGGMPFQAGYCNGRNSTFNGFEYHKAMEINIAVTDFMLALGHSRDISGDNTYSVDQAEVFYVEKGTVIEMFGTTLHLSPLRTAEDGFKAVVLLPRGVNTPLTDEEKAARDKAFADGDREARLLLQRGKWVISHPEREPLIKQGACPGVLGENRELFF